MTGLNEGWTYLSDAEGTWAYAICGLTFALFMIPGGRIQDRYGPKIGATLGGLCLAAGCILAGLMKSYLGLILGFGVLGGIGMGLGYAAATPAAVKWFHSSRRGLVVGLVVAGYGAAAIYISPLADYLIAEHGLTGSFVGAGRPLRGRGRGRGRLAAHAAGRVRCRPSRHTFPTGRRSCTATTRAREMLRTWQFYALVFLFIGSAQSGLLVIANAKRLLASCRGYDRLLRRRTPGCWRRSAASSTRPGRIGTGRYSDRIGRLERLRRQRRHLGRVPVRRAVGDRREDASGCCSWSSA